MNELYDIGGEMPVCITGMHRSGTSMVTRLLNLCGLYLGQESDLMEPAPDNPEGFWENKSFVGLNDMILAELGGAWDLPPLVEDGWEQQPEFNRFKSKAISLVQRFKGHEAWGWKDPRNSLTLPFWKSLLPDMKVVVCLRNPLEVAWSLIKRNKNSAMFGYHLWLTYNQRLLAAASPEQRIITHYDAYFADPVAELRRLLDFLGLSVSEEMLKKACRTISVALRHNRSSTPELLQKTEVPAEVTRLYMEMCEEAGPVCRQALAGSAAPLDDTYMQDLEAALKACEGKLQQASGPIQKSQVLVEIGELCFKLERFDDAAYFFEKALSLNPESAEALNNLGVLSFQLGDYRAAEELFRRALKLDPENEEAKVNIALLSENKL
jgi:hypothetical protein